MVLPIWCKWPRALPALTTNGGTVLAGEEIPIEGRITAVADVFDALCSERPYKSAWPISQACAEIQRCAGTQFDPACVAAFERRWPEISKLYTVSAIAAPALELMSA